jgi:hypothetical protein
MTSSNAESAYGAQMAKYFTLNQPPHVAIDSAVSVVRSLGLSHRRWIDFGRAGVRLDLRDVDALELAINDNSLPETHGFFFGQSDGSEKSDDLAFVHKARDALANGKSVFYWSWW